MWPIKNFEKKFMAINICLKYFMTPTKTLWHPPTYLMYGSLHSYLLDKKISTVFKQSLILLAIETKKSQQFLESSYNPTY